MEHIDIYAALSDDDLRRFELEYPRETSTMSAFASRFEERGLRAGEEPGMRRGQAAALLLLSGRKLGPPPEAVRQRVEEADSATLLAWTERIEDGLH